MQKPERRPSFINREAAEAYGSGDVGPCVWKGLCGRPGNREYVSLIEQRLGIEWAVDDQTFYCPTHTELAVEHAVDLMRVHEGFLTSDRMIE
jgi:hypothetical protein